MPATLQLLYLCCTGSCVLTVFNLYDWICTFTAIQSRHFYRVTDRYSGCGINCRPDLWKVSCDDIAKSWNIWKAGSYRSSWLIHAGRELRSRMLCQLCAWEPFLLVETTSRRRDTDKQATRDVTGSDQRTSASPNTVGKHPRRILDTSHVYMDEKH